MIDDIADLVNLTTLDHGRFAGRVLHSRVH